MEDFGVQFAFRDAAHFEALRAIFAELKRDKNVQEFRDPEEWKALVPADAMASFDWPSDEDRAAWLAVRDSTPIRIGEPEDQIGSRWNFYAVFEAVQMGEYLLPDVVETGTWVAELRIDPEAYSYGGLGLFIALVEAFGFQILGTDEYGRFHTRAELLQRRREREERDQG